MYYRWIREYKLRRKLGPYERYRNFRKALIRDCRIPYKLRKMISLRSYKNKLTRKSLTRLKTRCLITGRARSTLSLFKLSRIQFRTCACNKQLCGVRLSSW